MESGNEEGQIGVPACCEVKLREELEQVKPMKRRNKSGKGGPTPFILMRHGLYACE